MKTKVEKQIYPKYFRLKSFLSWLLRVKRPIKNPSLYRTLKERLVKLNFEAIDGFFSQGGQDAFVDLLLKQRENGVFVEIGANDGITFSNGFFFESQRGWEGVCVEPNPAQFKKLKECRRVLCLNLCVGGVCDKVQFPVQSDPAMSLLVKAGDSSSEGTVEIEQVDLPTLFMRTGFTQVDYLSVDTEGSEFDILQSLMSTDVRPRIISVEENVDSGKLDQLMDSLGYFLQARVFTDRIYEYHG